ncbi:glycosyltransferase family 1 protein [Actimicrobium sp. CCI2.3]|uniref:glycosyltransferase family 4 protein n=1 Tax=Actimicrobium sp. CCI2.3 TaxID=3048616 RepID=UPI002AB5361B|nr:glycosyltransferase family 1 protein [Actimicrobium sp. CCI2.3]MDY7573971.1 glycosyltransferase family 1 protein [Actimicrobium sp. CCI2.3]MEB0021921.1 glycosyltransferase family 1 protein [Actimicrobium sp. CCI2.3]
MKESQIEKKGKPLLIVDVSPLWEINYTGISNVVYELAKRFLNDIASDFNIKFSVFLKIVNVELIEKCLQNRSGAELQAAFKIDNIFNEIMVDENGQIDGCDSYGLFLHRKPSRKIFHKDSQLFYDFSFLLTQECHTQDTVNYHLEGLIEQIATTELFFCISESTANDLNWLFNVPKTKIVTALLGHNVDKEMAVIAREKIGGREVEPYFLMLGTIEPRKNIAIIFEWLKKNPDLLKKFKFIFAGGQGWGPSFSDSVKKYDLSSEMESGRILHLGYVDEALKATLIVGARAIFYPSIFEGFGLPVLEAMELGVPVIASCSTSIPEVLGDTGYYFDPYSVESLDQAFSKFILDQYTENIEGLLINAKQRAAEFSYDRTYLIIYEALCSKLIDS